MTPEEAHQRCMVLHDADAPLLSEVEELRGRVGMEASKRKTACYLAMRFNSQERRRLRAEARKAATP